LTVILNFHGLGTPHAGVDDSERPYWLPVDRFLAILDRVAALAGRGCAFRITFDDGNLSDLVVAAPALAARSLGADFFVLTGRLGQEHYLGEADVKALQVQGFGIGLHGVRHLDWRTLDEVGLQAETRDARVQLAGVLGSPVTSVAVPFGAYNRRVMAHLLREGFAEILTSDGGRATDGARIKPRTSLRADMDAPAIEAILFDRAGPATRLRRAASRFVRRHLA
jgi:peptidoglycan/xylan/chitin deacetylase (PgdA/CDA1 family)